MFCWILIYAFTLMPLSHVWANAPAGPGPSPNPTPNPDPPTKDPIGTKSGNNYFTEVDWSWSAAGVPVVFSRMYNSKDTYNSPVGSGWSHSFDWRLHQAREIVTTIVPPVTNQNFKVNLWEGTQLLCDGQVVTNGIQQTNELTLIPEFLYGAPIKGPVDAYVSQPGNNYSIDLDQPYIHGEINESHPAPVIGLEDMNSNSLPMSAVSSKVNQWLEVYEADESFSRYWDNNTNGVYWATDKNWYITSTNDLWTLHLPGGEKRIFNTEGRMLRHQDGWGKGISFTYTTNGLLTHAEHDSGSTLQFTYTGELLSGISAGADANLTYGYTTNGLLDTVTQQYGGQQRTRQYEYTNGVMTKRINPEGHEYNFGYELDAEINLPAKANALSVGDEQWYKHELIYRSKTLTDVTYFNQGKQQVHRYAFSSKNGQLTEHFGPGTNTVDAETRGIRYGHNGAKDKIEETTFDDSTGAFISDFTDYDGKHNPTATYVAYNSTNRTFLSTITWDHAVMQPASIENADGEKTTMTYTNGSLALLRAFISESNSIDTVYGYSTNGLLLSVTTANGSAVQYSYDSNGYPDTVTPAAGPKAKRSFDSFGFLIRSEILPETGTNGTGRITQYAVNPLGWLESVTFADGFNVSNQYNKLGDLTNTIDRAGRSTETTYTPESCLESRTQYLEQGGSNVAVTIAYDFDQQFNELVITEPRGRYVESYQLDIQDRITSVTNIEGQSMSFDYSVGFIATNLTRFDGSNISTDYDAAGRKASVTYSTAGVSPATVAYSYYADSQTKTVSDSSSTVSNSYNALNRLTGVSVSNSVSSVSSVVNYSHDSLGNLTNSLIGISNNEQGTSNIEVNYSYDAAERLTGIVQNVDATPSSHSFSLIYNPTNGMISSVVNTNSGIGVEYAYDIMDRREQINWTDASTNTLHSLDYDFDALGMITNKTDFNVSTNSTTYVYDTINRLTEEKRYNATDTLTYSAAYEYDLAGNRTRTVINGETNTYTLGVGNRLMSWGTNGSALYDVAGNTTNLISNDGRELKLQWDERYRLKRVDDASSFVEYEYDVMGRKISCSVGSSGQTNTEHYIYNGNHVAADLDGAGNVLRTYIYGSGIDNILSITVHGETTNTYICLKDHQDSVIALADESGSIVERYSYSAYGETRVFDGNDSELAKSAHGNRYTFQGREIDWDTGLLYFRARWYNSEIGRWLSKDLIGISGGLNLYVFCGNNPVNFSDPLGLYKAINRIMGSGQTTTSHNPISHSFIEANGTTYGWGSEVDEDGNGLWRTGINDDETAAKEANERGITYRSKDPSLDPFIEQAYKNLKDSPGSKHKNWVLIRNCKSELRKLIREAKKLQRKAEKEAKKRKKEKDNKK